ncbi:MAG: phosphate--acyl-ACP acyltransferase, partial [Bacteroidales bacterium]|nr:phosphate--acyl-ACP acyltransferase [Bacteroidales bacterium]
DVLYQYAILGSLYAQTVQNVENPRVALFNIGKEEEKGNLLTKATYQAMKGTDDFNFVGNIEGTDIFNPDIDVIVCDGFVGNTILKVSEAFYSSFKPILSQDGTLKSKFEAFNFEQYGGTPILGINKTATIGHGISNDFAIKNMILHTIGVVKAKLPEKIKEAIE